MLRRGRDRGDKGLEVKEKRVKGKCKRSV